MHTTETSCINMLALLCSIYLTNKKKVQLYVWSL